MISAAILTGITAIRDTMSIIRIDIPMEDTTPVHIIDTVIMVTTMLITVMVHINHTRKEISVGEGITGSPALPLIEFEKLLMQKRE